VSVDAPNPYASPSEDAQRPHSARFSLDDDQRKIISSTAVIMIIAGVVQIISALIDLIQAGVSTDSLIQAAVLGVIGSFVTIAGFSLRAAAAQGSVDALLAGFRQLFVVFLVKGIFLLLLVVGGLLSLLLMLLGMF
jgi:uncharacterized membrane-anchored protein